MELQRQFGTTEHKEVISLIFQRASTFDFFNSIDPELT